jgi:hypothetical protein
MAATDADKIGPTAAGMLVLLVTTVWVLETPPAVPTISVDPMSSEQ